MTQKTSFTIAAALIVGLIGAMAQAQLPDPGMTVDIDHTAVVVTDPQNDFLSPDGVTWAW